MKKIAFVTPWYGENIPGGAEMALRSIISHLKSAEINLEILTTCVKDFTSDWNTNYYKKGVSIENEIQVRRFPIKKRDSKKFDQVNKKLMNHIKITKEEENIFVQEMINSLELYEYMEKNQSDYDFFIFIPYMFGTTYYGVQICPSKSIMIPCFHDEAYFYIDLFKQAFSKVRGMIFNSKPEADLANKVYDLKNVKQITPGLGMDVNISFNAERFRKKFKNFDPFILYAGRKDSGKNVDLLIKYFSEYEIRNKRGLKLILIGGGNINIPEDIKKSVIDLGYLPIQDKYDAYAAATILCQPSINESFSYVIMESWICERPVLVHNRCEVTKNFVIESNGGLYFDNYFEFEGCLNYFMLNLDISKKMGYNGKNYVLNNFTWDIVMNKYASFLESLLEERK